MFNEIKEKAKNAGSVEEQIAFINQLKNINARTKELGELVKDRTSKLQGANIVSFNEETGKYEQITIPKNLKDFTQRATEEQLKEFSEDPEGYFAKLNEALYRGLAENEFTPPPQINEQASELLEPKFMSEKFEGAEEIDGKLVTTKKKFYRDKYLNAKFDEVIQKTTDENLVKEFALDNNLPIAEAAGIFNEKGEIYKQYVKDKRQEFLDANGLSANVISATNAPKDNKGSKTEIATANKVKELVNKFQDTKNPEAISQFLKPYGLTMQVDGDEVMLNSVQVESKDGEQTSKVKVLASGLDINNADEIYAALANNVGDISLDALGKVEFEDRTKGVSVPEATTEQKQEIEDLLKKGTVPSWIDEEDVEIVSSQPFGGEPQKIKFKGEVYDITDEKQAEDLFLKVQNERPIKEQDSKPNNEPEIGTTSDLPD